MAVLITGGRLLFLENALVVAHSVDARKFDLNTILVDDYIFVAF